MAHPHVEFAREDVAASEARLALCSCWLAKVRDLTVAQWEAECAASLDRSGFRLEDEISDAECAVRAAKNRLAADRRALNQALSRWPESANA